MTFTTMKVSKETLARLAKHGTKADTYEEILSKVLDKVESP